MSESVCAQSTFLEKSEYVLLIEIMVGYPSSLKVCAVNSLIQFSLCNTTMPKRFARREEARKKRGAGVFTGKKELKEHTFLVEAP